MDKADQDQTPDLTSNQDGDQLSVPSSSSNQIVSGNLSGNIGSKSVTHNRCLEDESNPLELDGDDDIRMDGQMESGDQGHYEEDVANDARNTWDCNIQDVHQIDLRIPKHRATHRTGRPDRVDHQLVSPVYKMQTPEVGPPPAKRSKQVEYRSPLLPMVGASNKEQPVVMQSGNAFTQFLGAMAEQTTTQNPVFKLNMESFIQKGKYHTEKSRFGLLGSSDKPGKHHAFIPADFVKNHLVYCHPEIIGQLTYKLSNMPTPGTTRDNCMKPSHFDMRIIGLPRLILDMMVEHGIQTMEQSGKFTSGQCLMELVACNRILSALDVRYDSGVQSLVVQRFGDLIIAEKGVTDICECLRKVVREVTLEHKKVAGFESISWNGFAGSGVGQYGGSHGRKTGKKRSRNAMSNRPKASGFRRPVVQTRNPDWSNPDSPNFIPRGFCMAFHGTGQCNNTSCNYSHQKWTDHEMKLARERVKRARSGQQIPRR